MMKPWREYLAAAAPIVLLLPAVLAITPEAMLAANWYYGVMANPSGEFALFQTSNYSWTAHESTTAWKRLDLKSAEISDWYTSEGISEVVFVGTSNSSILYLNSSNAEANGGISLYSADANAIDNATLVASLPAPYSGLKAKMTPSGEIHFLLYASAWPNGTAYNEQLAETPRSSARVYNSIYVRHWDRYLTKRKNAVFGGVLSPSSNSTYIFNGALTNYVSGICNVTCAESPQDLRDQGDYDLSPDGSKVVFVSKDIDLPLANYTSSQIWYVPFDGSGTTAVRVNARGSKSTLYLDAQGASSSPRFSPDGQNIGYFQQNGITYEADRRILYVAEADPSDFNIKALAEAWDRDPESIQWSKDSRTVFTTAADLGRLRIFPVPLDSDVSFTPKNITDEGSVSTYEVLPDNSILVSDSKFWTSCDIYTVTAEGNIANIYFQANKVDPALAGLSPAIADEFYYSTNTSETKQQAWIVYPEGFDKSKSYPLAFLIHGGPQTAQSNNWGSFIDLKVYADQGYVVIAPNPTGSTGWGQNLTDSIQGRWGSYPYWDLVHCWHYVKDNLPYVDTDRGIAGGASFGGYMANWMQGQEMGRWFKAFLTHDGVTSTLNSYGSDELWFMNHDFNGPFRSSSFKPGSPYYDWNPLLYMDNWATPHIVIHNELDYRLPVSEGILLFNVLQTKGVPSKFVNFPDENHGVAKTENSLVWQNEIFKWINYYSGISNGSSPY